MKTNPAWQLKMFDKSLKKKLKLRALQKHFDPLNGKRCLLITCGDNNGATNYHLKEMGGQWRWADFENRCIPEIEELLGEEVYHLDMATGKLPFQDDEFDLVVTIDVHEHLKDPLPVTRELYRIVTPHGKVIVTTPNGDEKKLTVRIKNLLGMTPKEYGHARIGFDVPHLERLMKTAGLSPYRSTSYSKFFTEMVELIINVAYVKILAKKSKARVSEGTIAPTTRDQLRSVQKSYRIYSLLYPFFWIVSQLDWLLFFTQGSAVIVEAKR